MSLGPVILACVRKSGVLLYYSLPTYRRGPLDHSSHLDEAVTLSYLVVPYPRFLTTTPGKTVRATQVPI